MNILKSGHRYSLAQFEPPLHDLRTTGPARDAYDLCGMIEQFPPSEHQTNTVAAASELMQKLIRRDHGDQVLEFIEKVAIQPGSTELETVRNGTTNEEVLAVLIDRMQYLQSKFPCRENAIVITKLEECLMWLNKRTDDRKKRNVEGK